MNHVVVHVSVPPVQRHLDATDAHLREPPGREAGAAKRRVSILGANRRGLLLQVEGPELFRGHHDAGPSDRLTVQRGIDATAATARECRLHDVKIAEPPVGAVGRHDGRHVGQLAGRVAGLERVVLAAEEAAACWPIGGQDRDMPGNTRAAVGSSWQQIAPIEGCSTVGSGR